MRHVLLDQGDGEVSACGYTWDAQEDVGYADDDEAKGEFVVARPGVRVTCPECCLAIRRLRQSMKGLRLMADV